MPLDDRYFEEAAAGLTIGRSAQFAMFPPECPQDAMLMAMGYDPQTIATVDMSTPEGFGIAAMNNGSLANAFLSRMSGHHRRDEG